jgi:hypothetical protein
MKGERQLKHVLTPELIHCSRCDSLHSKRTAVAAVRRLEPITCVARPVVTAIRT